MFFQRLFEDELKTLLKGHTVITPLGDRTITGFGHASTENSHTDWDTDRGPTRVFYEPADGKGYNKSWVYLAEVEGQFQPEVDVAMAAAIVPLAQYLEAKKKLPRTSALEDLPVFNLPG